MLGKLRPSIVTLVPKVRHRDDSRPAGRSACWGLSRQPLTRILFLSFYRTWQP